MRKTDDSKAQEVRLSDDLIAKCEDWAAEVAPHCGSDDVLHTMPWTRHKMTTAERAEWLASRTAH